MVKNSPVCQMDIQYCCFYYLKYEYYVCQQGSQLLLCFTSLCLSNLVLCTCESVSEMSSAVILGCTFRVIDRKCESHNCLHPYSAWPNANDSKLIALNVINKYAIFSRTGLGRKYMLFMGTRVSIFHKVLVTRLSILGILCMCFIIV